MQRSGHIPAGPVSTGEPSRRRLALLGDVHGNWRALAPVLAAVRAGGFARGVVTGDTVMRGDDPERCVRALLDLGWPAVAGNTDLRVIGSAPRPRSHPASDRVGSRSWTHRELSKGSHRYLASLPMMQRLRLGPFSVAVVHGRPDDPTQPLFAPEDDAATLASVGRLIDADVIVTGHTHRQMAARAADRLFVNPGSVGETLDPGDRRPRWAWLELDGDGGVIAHLEAVDEQVATVRIPRSAAARAKS